MASEEKASQHVNGGGTLRLVTRDDTSQGRERDGADHAYKLSLPEGVAGQYFVQIRHYAGPLPEDEARAGKVLPLGDVGNLVVRLVPFSPPTFPCPSGPPCLAVALVESPTAGD
jgi:hypothetical protein